MISYARERTWAAKSSGQERNCLWHHPFVHPAWTLDITGWNRSFCKTPVHFLLVFFVSNERGELYQARKTRCLLAALDVCRLHGCFSMGARLTPGSLVHLRCSSLMQAPARLYKGSTDEAPALPLFGGIWQPGWDANGSICH